MIPQLYGDGVIVAGDAAALVMNLGFTIRGMDLCAESARLAAETIIAAKEKGDYSKASLSLYEKKLNDSFIVKDMKHYRTTARCLHLLTITASLNSIPA